MLGPTATSDTASCGQPRESAQPPSSNRSALRIARLSRAILSGSLLTLSIEGPAFFHPNLPEKAHELKFLIDTPTNRNRRNSNKTNDGPDF
jgi:hypothetical protein